MFHHPGIRKSLLLGFVILFTGIYLSGRFELYDRILFFDKSLHLAGGFVAAWIISALFADRIKRMDTRDFFVALVGGALLIGLLWEAAEFAGNFSKNAFPIVYYYFHGGNAADTLGDLVADTVGALIFAISALRFRSPKGPGRA